MTTEIPEAEVVPDEAPGTGLVPRQAELAVTPAVGADELVARLTTIRDAMTSAMQEGVDYGRIPGIDKPSLFKPGSEKLGVLFQLDIQLENEKEWGPDDHLTVVSHATVYHAPTGTRLGYGEGICTTREKKYGKRKQERACPTCGTAAVIKGKKEYGGGWVCWKKRDGCGASFQDGDPAIEGQEVGEIDNPDIPDTWNTVVKMAEKRARIDAVLAVTGASALFTQDVEDGQAPAEEMPRDEPAPSDIPQTITPQEATALVQRARDVGMKFGGVRAALDKAGVPNAKGLKDNELLPAFEALTPDQAGVVDSECHRIADGADL